MQIEYKKIKDITPYENNPRKNDDAVEYVANSIKEFGFKVPIVISKDGVIVAGHTRLKAAKKLKMKEVPCIVADDLSEAQLKAFRLADNKVSEFAEWDLGLLDEELGAIFDIDMEEFGFNLDFLDDEPEITEDEPPELPEEPKSKEGDLYKLGEHRLICGDSTNPDVLSRLMGGVQADMVFTDPPYNVAMSRSKVDGSNNSIKNDDLSDEAFVELLQGAFDNALIYSKHRAMYWWIGFRAYSTLERIFKDAGIEINNCIVWDKGSIGLGGKGFRYQHELCIFSGEIQNRSESDVWHFPRTGEGLHPTMKPVALCAHGIKNINNVDTVLDLFGGSGSVLIACEQLARKCFMCELDPRYVDVVIERWENLTGKKAELIKDPD